MTPANSCQAASEGQDGLGGRDGKAGSSAVTAKWPVSQPHDSRHRLPWTAPGETFPLPREDPPGVPAPAPQPQCASPNVPGLRLLSAASPSPRPATPPPPPQRQRAKGRKRRDTLCQEPRFRPEPLLLASVLTPRPEGPQEDTPRGESQVLGPRSMPQTSSQHPLLLTACPRHPEAGGVIPGRSLEPMQASPSAPWETREQRQPDLNPDSE